MAVSPVVVEDGTVVTDANSFATVAEYMQYAANRGVTVADDDAAKIQLYSAITYLETFRGQYVGSVVEPLQSLSWPRIDAVIAGYAWPSDEIPPQLKNAQMQLALYVKSGIELMPTTSGAFVKREKVGPIETEYSEAIRSDGQPYFPLIDTMLADLLTSVSSFSLVSVRA